MKIPIFLIFKYNKIYEELTTRDFGLVNCIETVVPNFLCGKMGKMGCV